MKSVFRILLIFFLIFYQSIYSFSQTVKYRHYTVDNGLPSSEVYHVLQDSKGYIWFATNFGVSCFDGYNFTNYNNSNGLPDNTILETYEDLQGKIWFISMNCKLAFLEKNKILPFPLNDELAKHFKEAPYYIRGGFRVDKKGIVYLCISKQGMFKIYPDNSIVNDFSDTSKYKPDAYLNVVENNVTEYVTNFAYSTKIKILEKVTGTWGKYNFILNLPEKIQTSAMKYSIISKQGNLLFSSENYLMEVTSNKNCFTHQFEKGIISINSDEKGNLWVSFRHGGIKCFKQGDLKSNPVLHLFKDLSVSGFFRDREGGIWLTTLEKGVYYISNDLLLSYTTNEGLSEDNVTSLVFDGKYINALAGKLNKICIDYPSAITADISDKKHSALLNLFYDSYRKKNWASASFDLFSFISEKSDIIFKPELKNESKPAWTWAINDAIFQKDSICFSNPNKIIIIKNNNVREFEKPAKSLLKINSITSDNKNCIYVGSYDGLWKFAGNKYSYTGNINPLLKNRITVLRWNVVLNALIVGTKGLGILILKDNKVFQIDKTRGVSGNLITSLQMDDCNIWVGTDNGLTKISFDKNDIQKFSITNITTKNGLISNEVNSLYLFNDLIFAGTKGGITYFDTKLFISNIIPPPVYISGLSIMQKDTIITDGIELSYDKNEVMISYVGLSFKDAGNLEYRYKLEGTSGNWQKTRLTHIQYSKLAPGDYNFIVYASNENGVWSKTPAKLRFVIHPAFWQTLWFRSLLLLFIIAIVTMIYLYRLKIIKERNKLSHKANKYMLLSMGKQLNPHFIFNSLNAIQGFIFKNDKQSSNVYISEFALLMRKTLYNSQNDFIPLTDEIELLTSYIKLEAMRFENKFTYQINTDPHLDIFNWKIPPFILQPYVENAIIHGLRLKDEKGCLILNFEYKDNHILFSVRDDGIGREKSGIINKENRKNHISMGSKITDNRINMINFLHNYNISVNYVDLQNENGISAGTQVDFVFPVIL